MNYMRLTIGILSMAFASNASALSKCIPDQVEQVFDRSSTVVAATAEKLSFVGAKNTINVVWRVNASWKGRYVTGSELTTLSDASWPISKGQPMLLYLHGKKPHQLDLGGCSRSGPLQDRLRDVRDLYELIENRGNGA